MCPDHRIHDLPHQAWPPSHVFSYPRIVYAVESQVAFMVLIPTHAPGNFGGFPHTSVVTHVAIKAHARCSQQRAQ